MLNGNLLIGQSGGPTSVINSSLAGVIEEARKNMAIKGIYGMNYGISGFIKEQIINLGLQPDNVISGLRKTPSSALGSSRHKVTDDDLPIILNLLEKYNIRYLFLIGGNDTMDTIQRIETYCSDQKYELIGIGIPKTVDNDLLVTDHTPGFPSAARYNILSVLQGGWLGRDMKKVDKFIVYQTIGRDAGWLAASTALAKKDEDDAPHLIYCPERIFSTEDFLSDAEKCISKYGWLSVVVSEGLKFQDGTPVSTAKTKDKFNNIEFGAMGGASTGMSIHKMLYENFGYRGEFQVTESLNMSSIDRAEKSDLEEAYQCGAAAVKTALEGNSGYMITIERISNNPYKTISGKTKLSNVAINTKEMPADYLNKKGNFVTEKFLNYAAPLFSDIPEYIQLDKIYIDRGTK